MKRHLLLLFLALMLGCQPKQEQPGSSQTAFVNFTLIDGTGAIPVTSAVMIIDSGRIVAIGKSDQVRIPQGASQIDLQGKYVVPGLINSHGHVGDVVGIEGGHYSTENIVDNLSVFARYGITTVVSLGNDRAEAGPVRAVNNPAPRHARLYIAGQVVGGQTAEEATAVVDQNHSMGVDWMKIRVDDNLGTTTRMSEAAYTAAIARAHDLGYKVASHMYYLEDAQKLLAAGSDLMAHSVRDRAVDETFVLALKEKKVCYCPTLTREVSTFIYGETPSFFSDPFFRKEYDSTVVAPLMDASRQEEVRNSTSAQTYRKQLPVAMANLKTLSDAGVGIAFGTDSGIPTRFMGYFEHLEMAMMAEAGLSPMKIILSATGDAARCMGLKDVGTLEPGKLADFLVVDDDPLSSIGNLKKISSVRIGGEEIQLK